MRATRLVALGGMVLLMACQDVTDPAGQPAFDAAASVQRQDASDQAALARAVPAFGGFYLDESGRPTAYLTDLSQATALRARIGMLAAMRDHSADELVILQGRFPYGQLETAFARASQAAMALAGSVFTDLDETQNRIVVGVERQALVAGTRAVLGGAGLPAGSYDVIVTPPVYQVATLRDRFDPTVAGIQIHFSRWLCSLGANVEDNGVPSFITASHCTARQGGVEGTLYYQPTSSVDGTAIATEVEDPLYFKGGVCPKGRKCRYSDAARAAYTSARTPTLGGIAITSAPNNGSLTVTGSYSTTSKGSVAVGSTVNKVGRTTGWTRANVSRTCTDTGVSGSNIVLLCQVWVNSGDVIVGAGDSGSGVWTGSNNVALVGILWGGSSDDKTFIFSPMSGIEAELGTLTVH